MKKFLKTLLFGQNVCYNIHNYKIVFRRLKIGLFKLGIFIHFFASVSRLLLFK